MKKKRKTYDIQQKLTVIDFKKNNPNVTQENLAQRFNMPLGVINSTLQKMQAYESRRHKRKKNTTFKSCTDKIYEPLYAWIQNKRFYNHTITNEMVREMALKIAQRFYIENFKASNPWILRFKDEYQIKTRTISGEEQLVDPVVLINSYERFAAMLKKYGSKNFYNCDETGLFFKCTPKKTLVLDSESRASGKFSKERITLLLCANMEGDKEPPFVIGKYKNPHGFKNINMNNLGIQYANSNKSWMTSLIFKNWVERLNSKMRVENRKILLLLDNAPVHYFDGEFSNIELYFLPPNTTSKIQPIDQGIVHSFKSFYKKGMTRNLSMGTNIETLSYKDKLNKFKLVNALPLIIEAWNEVTVETIKNCFKKALNNWTKIDEQIIGESTDEKGSKFKPRYN